MIVTIVQAPAYIAKMDSLASVKMFKTDNWLEIFQNLGIFILAYNLTTIFHPVKSNLFDPSRKRCVKMCLTTISMLYFPYAAIGVLGYLSLGDDAFKVDLFPNRASLPGSGDYMMMVAKIGLVPTILTAYLMRIIVIKLQFFDFMGMKLTRKRNWIFV